MPAIDSRRIGTCKDVTYFFGASVLEQQSLSPSLATQTGQRLREERRAQGKTQAYVARKAGVSRETISRIETGREPYMSTILTVANALDLPIGQLLPGSAWRANTPGAVGKRLRERRIEMKLGLEELASVAGISTSALSRFERRPARRGSQAERRGCDEHTLFTNEQYATALSFENAFAMRAFCGVLKQQNGQRQQRGPRVSSHRSEPEFIPNGSARSNRAICSDIPRRHKEYVLPSELVVIFNSIDIGWHDPEPDPLVLMHFEESLSAFVQRVIAEMDYDGVDTQFISLTVDSSLDWLKDTPRPQPTALDLLTASIGQVKPARLRAIAKVFLTDFESTTAQVESLSELGLAGLLLKGWESLFTRNSDALAGFLGGIVGFRVPIYVDWNTGMSDTMLSSASCKLLHFPSLGLAQIIPTDKSFVKSVRQSDDWFK